MRFHSDDTEMFRKRQDSPIAEVTIQRDQDPRVSRSLCQNRCVVGAGLADFGGADNVMPRLP